jgi:hypothetical protein
MEKVKPRPSGLTAKKHSFAGSWNLPGKQTLRIGYHMATIRMDDVAPVASRVASGEITVSWGATVCGRRSDHPDLARPFAQKF